MFLVIFLSTQDNNKHNDYYFSIFLTLVEH
jgi:hypothetical protein